MGRGGRGGEDSSPDGHPGSVPPYIFGGFSYWSREEKSCEMSRFLCVLRDLFFPFTPSSSSVVSPLHRTHFSRNEDSVAAWLTGQDL